MPKISYSIFDCDHVRAVPMIASFANDGEMQPIYVRIDDESIKILSYNIMHEDSSGIDFKCKVQIQEYTKEMYLYYAKNEHAWFQSGKYRPRKA